MSKKIILIVICLIALLTSACMAAEKPLGKFTKEEAIQKLFAGRTLDPIEGIWLSRVEVTKYNTREIPLVIVKTSLLQIEQPQDRNYTYTAIYHGVDGWDLKYEVGARINNSEYPNVFRGKDRFGNSLDFLLINPTSFAWASSTSDIFVRIYPSP